MPDWGLIAAGLFVLALGLSVMLWSLFADRSKGRERCPRCWYDMSAIPGDTAIRCPECGRVAAARREFARTRRRWRTATAFFILAFVGGPLLIVPVIRKSGWWALVPTEVLIRTVDAEGTLTTPGRTEFAQRLMSGQVSNRQWAFVLERAAPAAIMTREKWPIGVPLFGDVAFPLEFTHGVNGSVSISLGPISPITGGPMLVSFGWRSPAPQGTGAIAVDLGVRPESEPGSQTIAIDCAFHLPTTPGATANTEELFRCRVDRSIQLTRSADDCITAFQSPSVDHSLQNRVRYSVHRTAVTEGEHIPAGWLYWLIVEGLSDNLDLGSPSFAIRIEFAYEGKVVATAEHLAPPRRVTWYEPPSTPNSLVMRGDCEAVYHADPLDPKWTMKIIGDPTVALRDRKATRYWSGTVLVPFPGQTPVRGP